MIELLYPLDPAPVVPERLASATGEMLPIVEPSGNVIGQSTREYCHGGSKLLHPVVHLHIINRFGELYLQKRSMNKDLLPGMWDTAVGGHVGYGESIHEALFREAGEELGFTRFNPVFINSRIWESERERELIAAFAAVGNFTLTPDGEEVSEGRFWPLDEIEAAIGRGVLTPQLEIEFRLLRRTLESLL